MSITQECASALRALQERVDLLHTNEAGRPEILFGATAYELRQQAVQGGMATLRGSGLQKSRDGVTTIDELARETVL